MNVFHWCLAFGPVAIYLLLIGTLNVRKTPVVVPGTRDTAALGLALSGLVLVGPMQLFFPLTAFIRMGDLVWAMMFVLYVLVLALICLISPPRLVVYNVAPHELRPVLAELVKHLDVDARWAGDCLSMPNLGVQLHISAWPAFRNISLVAVGRRQDYLSWQRLERELARQLRTVEVARNPRGIGLLATGAALLLCLLGLLLWQLPSVVPNMQLVFPL